MNTVLDQIELSLLLKNPLFEGFDEETIFLAFRCLKGEKKVEAKGRCLYPIGRKPTRAAIILKGAVDVSQFSMDGHHMLISRMEKGFLIAEALVCNGSVNDFLDIRTADDSVLFYMTLPSRDNRKHSNCPYLSMILQNLIYSLAEKTVLLNKKVQILGQRSLREKLLCYFENLSYQQNSRTIQLGYTREILASFVSADRSAVSRELNNMQSAGLISIQKNIIELNGMP